MFFITPLDIRQREFDKGFRGYDVRQVDKFKEEVAAALEDLLRENDNLKQKLADCEKQQKKYREIEEVLKKTMVMAQKQADELKKTTDKEIKVLMQQAYQRSEEIIQNAEKEAKKIMEEYKSLQKQTLMFKTKFKVLLEAHLDLLSQNDIFNEAAAAEESEGNEEKES